MNTILSVRNPKSPKRGLSPALASRLASVVSVLAAFSQAIYLQSEMGELFWITTEDAPLHRRCAQISTPLPKLSAGSQFHMDGHDLIVDRAIVWGVEQVIIWNKPLMDQVVNAAALYSWTHTFFTNLNYSHARGFGTFIPSILSPQRWKSGELCA